MLTNVTPLNKFVAQIFWHMASHTFKAMMVLLLVTGSW